MTAGLSFRERALGGLWGAVVGDALGLPVEFASRKERKKDPVTGMRGYGAHHHPPGTWSDDASLILCTVESLLHGFDLRDMGQHFVRWRREGHWTPGGKAFGIGGTTQSAVIRLSRGVDPELAGDDDVDSNGNGSLMRILPVGLRFFDFPVNEILSYAHQASSLTHRHLRSQMACGFYCLTASALLRGMPPLDAYSYAVTTAGKAYAKRPYSAELREFERILSPSLHKEPESHISSGFYVLETLEASIWCLINSGSFKEAILKAVNLGGDADTTGCVTGGLAGCSYGATSIPGEWLQQIARRADIEALFEAFTRI